MEIRRALKRLGLKALGNLVSVKAAIFVVACIFLQLKTIDQNTWLQATMIVVGARTANELLSIVKKKDEHE